MSTLIFLKNCGVQPRQPRRPAPRNMFEAIMEARVFHLASPPRVEAKDIEALYDCRLDKWITDAEGIAASWAGQSRETYGRD